MEQDKNWNLNNVVKKFLFTLAGILLVYLIVYVGTLVRNNIKEYKYIGIQDRELKTITISATGEAKAQPDTAKLTLGVRTEKEDRKEAQKKNTETMNELISKLKDLGIEEKNIQTTDYSLRPVYDYSKEEGRVLKGYEVSQKVEVTVKDLDQTGKIIATAGEVGANQIGGLDFEFEESDPLKQEARDIAIEKAKKKANRLANSLGITLGPVVSYNESLDQPDKPKPFIYGGAHETSLGGPEPEIEKGSKKVSITVNIGYQINS